MLKQDSMSAGRRFLRVAFGKAKHKKKGEETTTYLGSLFCKWIVVLLRDQILD